MNLSKLTAVPLFYHYQFRLNLIYESTRLEAAEGLHQRRAERMPSGQT